MAELPQLESAFMKAHQAGDKKAAGVLAKEIKRMRAAGAQSGETAPMPWSDFFTNLPADAWDAAKGVAQTMMHPIETAQGFQALGRGAGRNANEWLVSKGYPFANAAPNEQEAAEQQMVRDMMANAIDTVSDPTKLRNAIIRNPFDTMTLGAPVLGMVGKAAQVGGLAKTAGALNAAEKFLDPVNLLAKPYEAARGFAAKVPEGQTRLSADILRKTMPRDLSRMDELGENAMLVDASPSMVGLGRGVAAKVGKGSDALVKAMTDRELGKSKELREGSANIFGPGRDPKAMTDDLKEAGRSESKAFYDKAKSGTPEFRTPELADILRSSVGGLTKGKTADAKAEIKPWIKQVEDAWNAETPEESARIFHGFRQELDDTIRGGSKATSEGPAIKSATRAREVRDIVDGVLKDNVSGMKEGDAAYASRMKQIDDFEYGFDSLEGDKKTPWGETFVKELAKRDKELVKQGQASRITTQMGTQANDLSALRKMVGGEGDFNREKLLASFGEGKVKEGVALIERVGSKSQNFADVVRNSKTPQSLEAAKLLDSNVPFKADSGLTALGVGSKLTAKAANAFMSKVSKTVSQDTSDAIAKALVGNKATTEELLRALDNNPKVSFADKTTVRFLLLSASQKAE